jgi:acyl carrier protein
MTAHLDTADLTRLTSTGLTPITNEHGLALFDAALTSQRVNVLASPLNTGALTRRARNGTLDPILSALAHGRRQAATASPSKLATRLATQSPQQRLDILTAMVTATTAAVLAHPDPAALDPDRHFKDFGIDSLTALELRNTLNQHTGLTLPATLIFDHSSPAALANHLADLLTDTAAPAVPAAEVSTRGDEPVDNRLAYLDQAAFGAPRADHVTERAVARVDNRLSFTDQVMFLAWRATGQETVAQMMWVYEHPVDFDGLRRFHRNLHYGLVGRLIERSPLPFGRHRWISAGGPSSDIDIAERTRPRAELGDWADERAQLPIDPERGPGWHLGVLPLSDGSTAIIATMSHALIDGVGGMLAIIEAVQGKVRDFGYPPAVSRTRRRAMASDARETLQGAPEVGRALAAAAKLVFRRRHDFARAKTSRPAPILGNGADCHVVLPNVSIYIDLDQWDARANALGGPSFSLMAGIAAKLGERMGRRRAEDGAVTLIVPVSERTLDDTRANAVVIANVSVDPTQVTTDLSGIRAALSQGWWASREVPDEALQLLPLVPFIPKRAVKGGADALFGFGADLPVSCSNLGELPPEIGRPDGTDADFVMLRGIDRHNTRQALEQRSGLLAVSGGRIFGKMSISIVAYQPGGQNTKPHLRELAVRTLAEFGLTGKID